MLLIYTGNGKGKTSAGTGQALRACGQGLRTTFVQFMKSDTKAGEQRLLPEILGSNRFHVGGCGFFRNEAERPKHREKALETLEWCRTAASDSDMLVADELLYALGQQLITRPELEELIAHCAAGGCHLVLTGRGLPDWLAEMADLITEMREIKHPYAAGIPATKGVEF